MKSFKKSLLSFRLSSGATAAVLAFSMGAYSSADEKKSAEETIIALGGDTTIVVRGADSFSLPAKNASTPHRRSFVVGNSLFKENWVTTPASVKTRQGLGPLFNAQSCSTCHFKDGRGQPPGSPAESMNSMLVRLSIPGQDAHGGPNPVPNYGDQLNHRAIVGVKAEGNVHVRYTEEKGKYPDGASFSLAKPEYFFADLAYGPLPENLLTSPRVANQVIGLGLLEAIRDQDLLALADPKDRNGDGISGRVNLVWDHEKKKKGIGRFGWKANQPTVEQQSAGAFHGDMGITSRFAPKQNCAAVAKDCLAAPEIEGPEISDKDLRHLTVYMKLLAVPARRDVDDPQVKAGHALFRKAQCQSCHVETFVTGVQKEFPELSKQKIHPFTDLLLHDLGEALADGRPDFEADGREWRTPPLWGIGLFKETNGHTRYLHDGRARNLEEAILWHGGEAEASKKAYMNYAKSDREALIRFLETL